jgi:AcrR family transcriptional regulator
MTKSNYLSPQQRRQRNREEMLNAIVETARDIMREQGVATLNLNEIARRLKMQPPSLYEYFPGKMALYDHLFRLGTRIFRERLAQVTLETDPSGWAQLEKFFTVFFECAIENPDLFKLVYERHVPGFVPSEASMVEAHGALEEANQYLLGFLKAAQIDTHQPIEQMREIFFTLMHGMIALHLANEPDLPLGEGRFGSLIPPIIEMLKKAWQ